MNEMKWEKNEMKNGLVWMGGSLSASDVTLDVNKRGKYREAMYFSAASVFLCLAVSRRSNIKRNYHNVESRGRRKGFNRLC